jgi:hypothetical protein
MTFLKEEFTAIKADQRSLTCGRMIKCDSDTVKAKSSAADPDPYPEKKLTRNTITPVLLA